MKVNRVHGSVAERSRLLRASARTRAWITLAVAVAPLGCGEAAEEAPSVSAQALGGVPSFNVEPNQISTSGLSSGAFMAVQFHVAYSSVMRGVAAFAGGPFYCAKGSLVEATGRCMSQGAPFDVSPLVQATRTFARAGKIDSIEGLSAQNVFLFGGSDDRTVNPAVMDGLAAYYRELAAAGQVTYVSRRPRTAHTMPTRDYGARCDITMTPYIGACGYDGAGEALAAIYGPLAPPSSAPTGRVVPIRQSEFITNPAAHSLADTGYLYVPKSCASGDPCRVHVAFHGCLQNASGAVGNQFYEHAGYNAWADTNRILVVYPQTVAKGGTNPNACWDWFGYDSPDYATKSGPQMKMVKAIVDHLARGGGPVEPPVDPGTPPTEPPPPSSSCVASSNVEHVEAGRAYVAFGLVLAKGSNQSIGFYEPFSQVSLRELFPGIFVRGRCL